MNAADFECFLIYSWEVKYESKIWLWNDRLLVENHLLSAMCITASENTAETLLEADPEILTGFTRTIFKSACADSKQNEN